MISKTVQESVSLMIGKQNSILGNDLKNLNSKEDLKKLITTHAFGINLNYTESNKPGLIGIN